MIAMAALKKVCNDTVRSVLPDLPVYGNDATDGYRRPCFYSEMLGHGYTHETRNYAKDGATYKLTLLEECHDEAYCLEVFERVRGAFGMTLGIGGRHVLVGEMAFEYIGESMDILQISIEFDWMEQEMRLRTEEMMEHINVSYEEKG